MTLFVLLARQRSGTGALGSTLDQHPSISYLGEVFHHDAMDRPPNYFWFLQNLITEKPELAFPDAGPERWDRYAEYLCSMSKKNYLLVDIKYASTHHFNQHWLGVGEAPTLFSILKTRGVPIVHLTRRNYLKVYVSGKLAEANGVWHARKAEQLRTTRL